MLEGEAERKALQATKAESPEVEQPAQEEPSKDVPPAAVDPPADDDVAEEYDGYPTVGHAGQGSGLKTNMLLTADTLPPDVVHAWRMWHVHHALYREGPGLGVTGGDRRDGL